MSISVIDWNTLMAAYSNSALSGYPAPCEHLDADAKKHIDAYLAFLESRTLEEYDYIHSERFKNTVAVFGDFLLQANSIVELGGDSRIGEFAHQIYKKAYTPYARELRDEFDLASSSFDVVLCLEVIEHLKDAARFETSIDLIATFNYSGIINILKESFRILRPGGLMLITTPNACSVDVIIQVMRGQHPHLFDPHVRELAPMQIKAFGELVGFELEKFGTFFAWTSADDEMRNKTLKFIADAGFDPSNRGDDAFYALRKPAQP